MQVLTHEKVAALDVAQHLEIEMLNHIHKEECILKPMFAYAHLCKGRSGPSTPVCITTKS
eukprot:scaffold16058_cov171-Amphora_coffeaeformis.AAC.2